MLEFSYPMDCSLKVTLSMRVIVQQEYWVCCHLLHGPDQRMKYMSLVVLQYWQVLYLLSFWWQPFWHMSYVSLYFNLHFLMISVCFIGPLSIWYVFGNTPPRSSVHFLIELFAFKYWDMYLLILSVMQLLVIHTVLTVHCEALSI